MQLFLDKLISYIAPHECFACGLEGSLLCATCLPLLPTLQPQCYRCHRTDKGSKTCKSCRSSTSLRNVWIGTQYEGFAEELVKGLKFNRAIAGADTIATFLADTFATELPETGILVPVPTATSRVRQRGYDQSVRITKALAKKAGLPYANFLMRHGQQRQTKSSRSERLTQLKDAFIVRALLPKETEIILVDDILTTGASLEAAAAALKQAGAKKVSALVFARAE
jgi:ComF family protein